MREQILAAATRRFAAQGFDGTTLQAISEAVGIRKPSLLYHFKSKDELRRAVLEHMLSHWNEVLPRLLVAATTGEDQFEALVGEMIAFFTADPDRARLLVREVLDRPQEMRALLDRHVRPWVDQVCAFIRKGQRQGRLYAEADPEAYTVQVINLVIASVATHDCIGALLGDGHDSSQRNAGELLRVARCSLFTR
ncbi:MAG TPA: TetR/AcrR family transcriptional regulator [Kofleriaceae bacterium]|nr:TetR/AcrR family transcriptional regulator [Kofleriaceae bacterium]